MELSHLIKSRRTIHDFKLDTIDKQVLELAVELALWSPNHRHTHPWLFYRLGPKARLKLVELALQVNKEKMKEEFNTMKQEAIKKKFSLCPEIVVLARKKQKDEKIAKEDYASVACAVQNISLYLWEQGIGCKWTTGEVTRHPDVYNIISAEPESVVLEGFLWIGYPERVPSALVRPPLNEVFFYTL